jgi:hypothetical protein
MNASDLSAYLREMARSCEGWRAKNRPVSDVLREASAALQKVCAERDELRRYLRQHAIAHDPTKRPMRSWCEICEADWGGDDAEHHGEGCPFAQAGA